MIINLKQIRTLDTDNIKLDKINYNFDQLIANSGGPKGYVGPDGNTGYQGFRGAQGTQGFQGLRGAQGIDAVVVESYWNSIPQNFTDSSNIMSTLFARHPISGTTPTFGAVIAAGYIGPNINGQGADNGYIQQQSNSTNLPKYQWVVNRRSAKVASNLRFTSSGILTNSFDITMDNSVTDEYRLYLGFTDNLNSQLNLKAEKHIVIDSNDSELFDISTTSGNTYSNTIFEKQVKFNAPLSIENANPGVNKILTTINTAGDVTFKTTDELGGDVKIGTIISILPSIFSDSSKFINYQFIDTNLDPNNPLKIRIGAGIGDYDGWYVCNGQQWTDNTVAGTTLVPDLNSFSYQILANPITEDPNSQGYIGALNDDIQLIGGAAHFVNASIPVGATAANYNINIANQSTDPIIVINPAGGQFRIKKLPQIIYLRTRNLWWSKLGSGQTATGDYNNADYVTTEYNVY
jgi:hypothetical protein